uniref:Uncharacterized protein n=1 Tax=Knipowitschia caucasica TaxID=637954 RepID=A0AAV2KWJ1_KNICA
MSAADTCHKFNPVESDRTFGEVYCTMLVACMSGTWQEHFSQLWTTITTTAVRHMCTAKAKCP